MSDRFYVGSRKGLFTFELVDGKWSVSHVDFIGDNVTMLLPDQRDDSLYCALNLGHFGVKLHRRSNQDDWQECSVPVYPTATEADKASAPGLLEIWSLETGGRDQDGLLWCGTIPGGLFKSTDQGSTWQLVNSLWDRPERADWFGGGKDHPGIHSICVDPRDSKHVTVAISCGGVWTTFDAGETWEIRADGMRAEYMPPEKAGDPNIQDPHLIVNCRNSPDHFWTQHHNGVFRTSDDCKSWQEVPHAKPSVFGFAVAVDPNDPGTAWFVPAVKDECRVPVDGRVVVSRTTDGGETFEVFSEGLPTEHAYDIVFRHCLAISDDGKRLVMGSSTGSLWVSDDRGESWQTISKHLPQIYCVRF